MRASSGSSVRPAGGCFPFVERRDPTPELCVADATSTRTSAAGRSSRRPEINRLAQMTVVRPGRKPHLGHQLWTHPMRRLVGGRPGLEGRGRRFPLREQSPDPLELLVGESATRVADVTEAPAGRRNPQQQRPEASPRAARLGEPTDHEFLPVRPFHLPPFPGTRRPAGTSSGRPSPPIPPNRAPPPPP